MNPFRSLFPLILISLLALKSFAQINPQHVTIARDSFGVPHIFAPTDAETAYGLAWAHSEDDFENIQCALLASKGMLARVKGIDAAVFDFALQFFKIDSLVEARYEQDISPDVQKVIEGYVQGVNDYAQTHPKEVLLKKAFPLTAQDVVKGYVLSGCLMADVGLALTSINENRVGEYFNVNDIGSNAMAIAPEKMEDGKAYLLANPHQPIEGRFILYEAHLNSEEGWNMIGGLLPGGISVFMGSNTRLGWSHTHNYNSFGDLHKLEINPNNNKQYKLDGEWKNLREEKLSLTVKVLGVRLPVKKKVYYCEYGPVFESKHGMYAFRFPSYTDIRSVEQWFRMNKAQNMDEFEQALKMQALPLFNVIYADVEGNIMYHCGGRTADRNPDLDWEWPITAANSQHIWTDIIPYERMPIIKNPSCGFVYNANHTPLHASGDECNWQGDFPGLQKFVYNRGEQFGRQLKKNAGKFTASDLDKIKFTDSYLTDGAYMKNFGIFYQLDPQKYPDIAPAIQKIKQWDLRGNIGNKDAALMMIAHDFLHRKLKLKLGFMMVSKKKVQEEDAVWAIREAQKLLLKTHGTLDVRLGEVQFYVKGDKMVPADGLREVPRATDSELYNKRKGTYKIVSGDSYIQIARFSKEGVEIKSVNILSASNKADSPHYDDQMEMFAEHQYKNMTFDKEKILKEAERIYHPGAE